MPTYQVFDQNTAAPTSTITVGAGITKLFIPQCIGPGQTGGVGNAGTRSSGGSGGVGGQGASCAYGPGGGIMVSAGQQLVIKYGLAGTTNYTQLIDKSTSDIWIYSGWGGSPLVGGLYYAGVYTGNSGGRGGRNNGPQGGGGGAVVVLEQMAVLEVLVLMAARFLPAVLADQVVVV